MVKRTNSNTYWLYGKHSVCAAINNPLRKIDQLLLNTKAIKIIHLQYDTIVRQCNIRLLTLTNHEISKRINITESVHQGFAARVQRLNNISVRELIKSNKPNSRLLILDQVTDPNNIGSIIRSSLAFGIDAVITTKNYAPIENASIVKSSSGAFENMPYIQVTNITTTVKYLKSNNYWIASIVQNGHSTIKQLLHFNKLVLIVGSEGKGIRHINLKESDIKVKIQISPMLESLNVSNATAIVLHYLYCQNIPQDLK